MTEVHIRPATPADATELSQLICENAREILRAHYSEEQWEIFLRYYSTEAMVGKIATQAMFCATMNNQIVGCIGLENDVVVGFYTRLQNRNQGIGKLLMNRVEACAKEIGLQELQLAASPEGVGFYFKNGWEKVKDCVMEYYGVGFNETLMKKKL
jgi:N-acetylglutamate synthase-like GNAT family acetyltransferase